MLSKLDRFKNGCINFVVNRPKICIFLILLPYLALIPFISRMQEDYSVRTWFRTTDVHLKELDQFERQFGNDQVVLIGVKAKNNIFNEKNIHLIQKLTEESWKITDVIRVESLANYNYLSVNGDNLSVNPFIPDDLNLTAEVLNSKRQIALSHRNILNRFIDKKGEIALIHAQLAPKLNGEHESDYQKVTAEFQALLDKNSDPDVSFILLGAAPLNDAFRKVGQHDVTILTPISLLIIGIILFCVLRTFAGVLVPLFTVALVILSSFGLAGIMGVKFNNMTSAIPGIMLAIALAEIMHILVVYYRSCDEGMSNKEAMHHALDKNFYATFLTSITTAFGFVGDIFTELIPISDLGFMSSFGTISAWIMAIFLVAPIVMLVPYRKQDRSFMDVRLFKNPAKFVDGIYRHYKMINTVVILLLATSIYLALKLEVNSEPFSYFRKSAKIRQDNDLLIKEFKGMGGPQIVIQTREEGGINDPAFLKKVSEFEAWIESKPYVNQVVSVLDIVKDLSQNLHAGDPAYYKIPDSRKEIAEAIFLYTLSLPAGMDLNNLMTVDQEALRFSVFWSLSDSKTSLQEIDKIQAKATELGLKIYVSGKFFLYNRMNDYVVSTFNQNNIWALLLIGGVMMAIFQSFGLGLISLIPNVIPLIYGMGLLVIAGGTLDLGTALVTSVCFGITVDDTIHFLLHYQDLLNKGKTLREALIEIYDITAPSLIFTTLLLVCGFSVFIAGDFVPNIWLGVLCALILTIGVVLELLFTPALLIALSRKGRKSFIDPV